MQLGTQIPFNEPIKFAWKTNTKIHVIIKKNITILLEMLNKKFWFIKYLVIVDSAILGKRVDHFRSDSRNTKIM